MKQIIRQFFWLVNHDRLMINKRKATMQIGTTQCDYCKDAVENTLHVLRDYPIAMVIWVNLLQANGRGSFFNCNLEDWINLNIRSSTRVNGEMDQHVVWATVCYML